MCFARIRRSLLKEKTLIATWKPNPQFQPPLPVGEALATEALGKSDFRSCTAERIIQALPKRVSRTRKNKLEIDEDSYYHSWGLYWFSGKQGLTRSTTKHPKTCQFLMRSSPSMQVLISLGRPLQRVRMLSRSSTLTVETSRTARTLPSNSGLFRTEDFGLKGLGTNLKLNNSFPMAPKSGVPFLLRRTNLCSSPRLANMLFSLGLGTGTPSLRIRLMDFPKSVRPCASSCDTRASSQAQLLVRRLLQPGLRRGRLRPKVCGDTSMPKLHGVTKVNVHEFTENEAYRAVRQVKTLCDEGGRVLVYASLPGQGSDKCFRSVRTISRLLKNCRFACA